MKCRLAQFYGWTPELIENMDFDDQLMYWRGITMLDAQEMLNKLKVADWPNMEKSERSKLNKILVKEAYFKPEIRVLKTTDLVAYSNIING